MTNSGKITKHFSWSEAACKDELHTEVPADLRHNAIELAQNLEILRDAVNAPVIINSWYRTGKHNKKLGGALHSTHLTASGADIFIKGWMPKAIADLIEALILNKRMKQGGLGIYNAHIHYDIRGTKVRWDLRTKNLEDKK